MGAIPLWIFSIAAVLLLGMAVRALMLERSMGLPPSKVRTATIAGVAIAILALAMFSGSKMPGLSLGERSIPEMIADRKATITAMREEIVKLEKEIADLEKGIKPAVEPLPAPTATIPNWAIALAGVLLLVAVGALFLLGDPETLNFRKWWRRLRSGPAAGTEAKSLESLEALAIAAEEGQGDQGLEHAAKINERDLDRIERLDLLFLRAHCAVLVAAASTDRAVRKEKTGKAIEDLVLFLGEAPNSGPGEYLLALARGLAEDYQPALDGFRKAKDKLPGKDLPFAKNESVCLLSLAQQKLAESAPDRANELFREAGSLGVLKDRIPVVLIENHLLNIRKSLNEGELARAHEGIALIRKVEGLDPEQAETAKIVADVFSICVGYREGRDEQTIVAVREFLEKQLPANLPPAAEEAADEYLEPAIDVKAAKLPAELFRAFFFLEGVVRMRMRLKKGPPVTAPDVAFLAEPLLRALQCEPRHREALAALGALYYRLSPEKKMKALEWMESAIAMGAKSTTVRRILERDREIEAERKGLLDRFLSTSSRFLSDPTVSKQVRRALIDELGKFTDFQPLIVELEHSFELPPQTPTIQGLRDRARYLEGLVVEMVQKRDVVNSTRLGEIRKEYGRLLEGLEGAMLRLGELDKNVIHEMGKAVLR